jgi:hypothetical protein
MAAARLPFERGRFAAKPARSRRVAPRENRRLIFVRREKYGQSGRNSKVLVKKLK